MSVRWRGYLQNLRNPGFAERFQEVTFCNPGKTDMDWRPSRPYSVRMDVRNLILVVEDDDEIRDLVCRYLRDNGYDAIGAATGKELDQALLVAEPHLIVLDIMLPGGEDGLAICRRLRATMTTPIIMLTAKGDEIDRIVGIELGADDYMSKPFNPRELAARIGAVLRRTGLVETRNAREVRCGHILVNYDRREVCTQAGEVIELSSGEYALLTVFMSRPQRVLDRDILLELASGRSFGGAFDRSIDVQVSRLRRKIELDPANPVLIKTVRNGGYILAEKVQTA
jgi:two-component system, OmpR family, response regulator